MNAVAAFFISAAGFTTDRFLKVAVNKKVKPGSRVEKGRGPIGIGNMKNKGFALNKFDGHRKVVLGVSIAVMFIFIAAYAVVLLKPEYECLRLGFAIAVGGAAGNVYDRLKDKQVTDYVYFRRFGKLVFNLADVLIVTGCLIALASYLVNDIK